MAHSNDKVFNSIEEFEASNTKKFEKSGTKELEFEESDTEEFEFEFEESDDEEFEGSGTEKFEESGIEEFKGSGTKKFEGSGTEEFEDSSIKESKALKDWFEWNDDRFQNNRWLRHPSKRYSDKWIGVGSYDHHHDDEYWRYHHDDLGKSPNANSRKKFEFRIIDNFIREKGLKWIPYVNLKNVKYLSEGGFGTIHKAIWLNNDGDKEVILKCHKNLNENLSEFLNEWKYHENCLDSNDIINLYGFTEDPKSLKYMIVMEYANKGNLRENLTKIKNSSWNQKLYMLYEVISGLNKIHEQNLIHCDFHDGNILNHNNDNNDKVYISDLGLCQPVQSFLKKHDIYGVIPFMAPEILRGKSYTPASDIYSFSMIMWEFTSGVPPFNNRAHDLQLSLSICKGERPEIIENSPQCYVDLMKKCWDEDPLKRPSSKEVLNIIKEWVLLPYRKKIEDINEELKCNILKFINAPIGYNNLATEPHPQAYYTSRLLDFTSKELNEILESKNLDNYIIKDLKSLDENIGKNLKEIFESEDSQTSVKVNEMPVSEDLNNYIFKDLKSLD